MNNIQQLPSSVQNASINIPNGWKLYKWKDLIETYEQGLIRSNSQLCKSGTFYFKMNNISTDGMCDYSKKEYTKTTAEEDNKYYLENGDFLINVRNSYELVGKTCVVSNLHENAVYNHMLIKITHKDKRLNFYINSLFSRTDWKKYIEGCRKGTTTVIALYKEDLENILIPIPPELEFAKIVDIEKEICEIITINDNICSDLEAMTKLLYDYWFVQFDFPDENGKPYRSSGGKMVWNNELKREIPEGWEVKSINDIIASSKNGDWGNEHRKQADDIEVTCFRGADFSSITSDFKVTAPTRYINAKNSDKLLAEGDLVTEISGGSPTQATGRIGYITQKFLDRNGGKMDCSNFCKAFTPKEKYYQFWLYQVWKAFYNAGAMFNFESKTTGIKNLMFDEFIKSIHVPVPSQTLLKKYQNQCALYYDKIQSCFIESQKLAELRDFLLPMLMNGQVKVGKEVNY